METTRHELSLTATELAVERGGRVVVASVSFDLSPGDALTLRGANGTGKTSILRAVAGFARPSDGTVSFREGRDEADPAEVRATNLHWLGGDDALADKLTVGESLRFWAQLLGGGVEPDLVGRLGLSGRDGEPLGRLSTGQRRRVGIGRLLCAPRALWLLDEPMSGLDDQGRDLLLSAIADHRQNGGMVLMASHDEGIPGCPVLRLSAMEAV